MKNIDFFFTYKNNSLLSFLEQLNIPTTILKKLFLAIKLSKKNFNYSFGMSIVGETL